MRGTSHWYVNLDLHLYGGINPVWFQDRFAPFGVFSFLFLFLFSFSSFSYIVNFVNPRACLHPGRGCGGNTGQSTVSLIALV